MSIRPELWGWSTSPLTISFWGWEAAGIVQNIISGIPRIVRGEPEWKIVHNTQAAFIFVHGTFTHKTVLSSFIPGVVIPDDRASKIIRGTFTPKILRPESIASRTIKENKASAIVRQAQRPAIIGHAPAPAAKLMHTERIAKIVK